MNQKINRSRILDDQSPFNGPSRVRAFHLFESGIDSTKGTPPPNGAGVKRSDHPATPRRDRR